MSLPLTASVALATYNGARFLGPQLDSILAQTELPDEIVVTDDQSTDGTIALLEDYTARSPVPIRIHRNDERLGFTRNFARAIGLCRSELIFLCDQDDLWLPGKVERMKREFADPAVLLAYHGALVVTGEDQPLYEFYQAAQERALIDTPPIHPWYSSYGLTQAFRSSLRAHDDLWPRSVNHVWHEGETMSHDSWYYFLAQVFGRITYVDETLVRYRQHGRNSVGAARSGRASGLIGKVQAQLEHDPRLDRLKASAAERRAELLDELRRRDAGAGGARAEQLAGYYRHLARALKGRYAAYTADGRTTRAASLVRLVASGGYRGHPWGFKSASIVRDLLGGVIGHRRGSEPTERQDVAGQAPVST